jgi:hypothetical protein
MSNSTVERLCRPLSARSLGSTWHVMRLAERLRLAV